MKGMLGFDFYPIFGLKTQKRAQTGCVFSGVSSPRVCGPRQIHRHDDSPKSSSRSAFPKNQPRSPPCPLSCLPTPSPTAPDSSPIYDSSTLPGLPLPSPAAHPGLPSVTLPAHPESLAAPDSSLICDSGALPGFATPIRWPVPIACDSHADPLFVARAGHSQCPWSITCQVLLHHSADPTEISP
jgi:hypothetical protein